MKMDAATVTATDETAIRFTLVVERLVRHLRAVASADGMSTTASSVLARLRDSGPQRITVLARSEGVSQPALTQLADRLVTEGYAVRVSSPDDGRVVLVDVTAHGLAALEQRHHDRVARLDALVAGLGDDDRAALEAALPALERLVDIAAARK
ncbi:MarR family winged helix-turn-helix transcriptional regulator [Microbacterium sp.]|uniref:MarR family winged helix-turn-helix transcriptional regulator n=1 Tax=Microbacterium sp. TaxID=51671 RepID=UPI0039E50F27